MQNKNENIIYFGIDPDVNKSGCAIYSKHQGLMELLNVSFFELFNLLKAYKENSIFDIRVYIEGGWLNKSNWHSTSNSGKYNAQIGQRTGANHETGKKIVEMCEYLDLEYKIIKPTKSKSNSISFKNITGFRGKTNQEQRDAALLVFGL